MVKKRENNIVAKRESKLSFPKRLITFFKERTYFAVGGSILIIAIIIVLISSLTSRNDAEGDFQTAIIERGDLTAIVGATGIVEPIQFG